MRRHQQNQILELIQTLHEATGQFKQLALHKDFPLAMTLLADCQNVAAQIGNFIEETEGEGTQTVALLEEYCEDLFRASAGAEMAVIDCAANLQRRLVSIESSIRNELKPNKLEVVFLSYKASMSDSLESIWLAASKDPQCDAYFITIPYFDRLPGGAAGTMHNEGGMHPANIPITDYRTYNIAERHPDVIFFNNPYDDSNYVTSVHPNYYSKQLRDFTDLLVYVPYFVSTGDVDEQFCKTSACVYANKVVVQSQKIRDTYMRVYEAFEKEMNIVGRFGKVSEKFLALGSPKFDKAISAKPRDYTVPDEWRILINRSDGTRKKIILYNTTLVALLSGNEDVLKKLIYVLNIFKNRDDVVLWWRPHPLNEAAYQSMRPQFQNEYRQIVDDYRREGFGIYDDTADLHRAIAVSDAYYGDYSSLVALYQCTGKPIILQAVASLHHSSHTLLPIVMLEDEQGMWLLSKTASGLFRYERKTSEIRFIGSFPDEGLEKTHLFHFGARLGQKLYFAPMSAAHIGVYDLTEGSFSSIDLPKFVHESIQDNTSMKFSHIAAFGDHLFLLGRSYPAIVRYDTKMNTFSQYTDWLPAFEKLRFDKDGNGLRYFTRMAVVGSVLAAVIPCANAVTLFDMKTCVSTVYQVGSSGNRYSGICFDGAYYWLSVYEGHIVVRWNAQTGQWKEITTGVRCGALAFSDILWFKNHLWVVPYAERFMLKVDPQSEAVEKIDFSDAWPLQTRGQEEAAFWPLTYMDSILFPQYHGSGVMAYDVKTGKLDYHHLIVDRLPNYDYSLRYGDFRESSMYTLHDYLDDVTMRNESDEVRLARARVRRASSANGDGTAGEKIYAMAKKENMEVRT